jgi:hypothetical protein
MADTAVLTLRIGFHVFMDVTWDHWSLAGRTRRSPAPLTVFQHRMQGPPLIVATSAGWRGGSQYECQIQM